MDTYHPRGLAYERTTSVSALDWLQEFDAINLPHFRRQYIQLVHTPLDVMHECLKLQLGLQLPDTPSHLTVKQQVCTSGSTRAIENSEGVSNYTYSTVLCIVYREYTPYTLWHACVSTLRLRDVLPPPT